MMEPSQLTTPVRDIPVRRAFAFSLIRGRRFLFPMPSVWRHPIAFEFIKSQEPHRYETGEVTAAKQYSDGILTAPLTPPAVVALENHSRWLNVLELGRSYFAELVQTGEIPPRFGD